jgi:hypothetical protein
VLIPIVGSDPVTVRALVHDLEELRSRQTSATGAGSRVPALVAQWRDALWSDAGLSYRDAGPHVDDLARAIKEPGLDVEDRVEAARAFLSRRIEPARDAVARAAERMVLAENRDALLRLAEEDGELSSDVAVEPRRVVS